jgi:glycosyltransferase involved in cell wall biosynthesis
MNLISEKATSTKNIEIQVFLATHNRPHLIERAIDSILKQCFNSFELIISDNSTNDVTQELIQKGYGNKLKYIRRFPSVSAIDHLNIILQNVTSEYFMIFHDDDCMHFNMLEVLHSKINSRKEIIAIGANARIIENEKLKESYFYPNLKTDITITNRDQIVYKYLTSKIVPFPSYLYRNEVAKRLSFQVKNGGNHCDAAFIMDLLTLGFVIFSATPLMDYNSGDGGNRKRYQNHFIDFIKLVNYISKTSKYSKKDPIILRLRMINIYAEFRDYLFEKRVIIFTKRYFSIINVIFKISPFEYFGKVILITLYTQFKHVCKINRLG